FGAVETGHEYGWQALPGGRGHTDLEPEGVLILAYTLHNVTLRGSRRVQTGASALFPHSMLMRCQERAHIAATEVIWTGIPQERGHNGVDKLNDAISVEHADPLQGASDEVTVVCFALVLGLLQASMLESLTRREATISGSRLPLGISERRRDGY